MSSIYKLNKKGFGMVFFVLLTFVVVFTSIIGFVYFNFSYNMVDKSSSTTRSDIEDHPYLFTIEEVRYHEDITEIINTTNESENYLLNCKNLEKILIVDLLFNTTKIPESCEIKVDGQFEKHIFVDFPEKGETLEALMSIPLKKKSSRETHIIESCCDAVCHKMLIEPEC